MKKYKLIYDASEQSQRFGIIILPLVLVIIGLAIFLYHKNVVAKNAKSSFGTNKRKFGMLFGSILSAFAIVFTTFIISDQNEAQQLTNKIIIDKKYKTVEGLVQNYHPMPAGGHDTERFSVDSVQFEYSDYDLTNYGYNNTASHGGVIKNGLHVRIDYFNNGIKNVILKLETE